MQNNNVPNYKITILILTLYSTPQIASDTENCFPQRNHLYVGYKSLKNLYLVRDKVFIYTNIPSRVFPSRLFCSTSCDTGKIFRFIHTDQCHHIMLVGLGYFDLTFSISSPIWSRNVFINYLLLQLCSSSTAASYRSLESASTCMTDRVIKLIWFPQ